MLGGDSLPQKKPSGLQLETAARHADIAPANAAMIGDSMQDFSAARAAGFRFVWATYGYCARLDAPGAESAPRIDRFDQIAAVLAGLDEPNAARTPS